MNNRLSIQDLALILSEQTGKSTEEALRFLQEFIAVVSEGVYNDKLVKVKGLGTFKIIRVEERASVSVNSGERFVIPSHYKFTFTPETSGSVSLAVGGQWAKTPEARGWLAVSKLSVNGTPVSNADLKKVSDRNGKQIPNGFWVYGKTVYVADGGPDGAAAMLVNHDSRLTRVIKVEGGQPVTVEYMAKAVETPAN